MYILSDMFLGNIVNGKYSFLKGNSFYYTNDGKEYKCQVLEKEDVHEGILKEFYCKIELIEWVHEPEILKEFYEKGNKEFYIKVDIDPYNNITAIHIVPEEKVDNKLLITAKEGCFIDFNDNKNAVEISSYNGTEEIMERLNNISSDKSKEEYALKKINFICNYNVCFPDMYFRKDVRKYVFKNSNIMTYKSSNIKMLFD